MKKLRIVFMGTPEFAVETLRALVENNYSVVGVITAPDKPAGRGRKIQQSAVKAYALEQQLTILQPTNLKNEQFLKDLKDLHADIQIVVAFRMLPKEVWSMPRLGTFNLHASLLPDYRGAAPINWAIINGENKTGVTTFFINENIDTGAILLQKEIDIPKHYSAGDLHDELMVLGSSLVLKTLDFIEKGNYTLKEQHIEDTKPAPKLHKENCAIDWNKSMIDIYNKVRGLSPYPAAWTTLYNKEEEIEAKIYKTEILEESHDFQIGKLITSKNEIKVAVNGGYIKLLELKLAGKRKMDTKSLLNGYAFSENAKVL